MFFVYVIYFDGIQENGDPPLEEYFNLVLLLRLHCFGNLKVL